MITVQAALNRLIDGNELFYDEMLHLMRQIMTGELSQVQTAALLMGLRCKVESVSEISAAATVMRDFATPVHVADHTHLVDIVGTGGDRLHSFNISTTSMFVLAAAGGRVAKHGGRAVSSSSGSADALEALGVNIALTPEQVGQCIDELGVGFMFAPSHHSAMKYVAPVRKELGVRTIFNILGPLTNPARAENQLIGVFHADLVGIVARVLQQMGSKHAMVVMGRDGMDEITLTDTTLVAELRDGKIDEYQLDPREFGFELCEIKDLHAANAAESIVKVRGVLDGKPGPERNIVLLNAGAAIYTANLVPTLKDGIARAAEVIDNGAAKAKMEALVAMTQSFKA